MSRRLTCRVTTGGVTKDKRLRTEADQVRREIAALRDALARLETIANPGRRERLQPVRVNAVERLRAAEADLETLDAIERGLRGSASPGKVVNEQMTSQAKNKRNLAISDAKAPKDPLARLVRKKLGLSLNAYAKDLGCSTGALHNWRTGKYPAPEYIAARVKRDLDWAAWPKGVARSA